MNRWLILLLSVSMLSAFGCKGLFPAWMPLTAAESIAMGKKQIADIRAQQARYGQLQLLAERLEHELQMETGAGTITCAASDYDMWFEGRTTPVIRLQCLLKEPNDNLETYEEMEQAVKRALRRLGIEALDSLWSIQCQKEWVISATVRRYRTTTSAPASRPANAQLPPALVRRTGTVEQAQAWARVVLDGADELVASEHAIGPGGLTARFYCYRRMGGSGGNAYAVFLPGKDGLRYIGILEFGALCALAPDAHARPRIATLWHMGASEGVLSLHVLTGNGLTKIAETTVVPGDVLDTLEDYARMM